MRSLFLLSVVAFASACGGPPTRPEATTPKADLVILQLNDVYEMNPISGAGGLARVATLRDRLAAEGEVLTLLAGDFLSPSAIGLAKVDGERLAGAQMVATFNAMGLDLVTFGNHEFDVKEAQLLSRLGESKFKWISSNVTRADGSAFPGVETHMVRTVRGVKVGLFGLTLDSNKQPWVKYDTDYQGIARREVAALKAEGAEVIVAMTHLDLHDDIALAGAVPEIDIIVGGHEHENWRVDRGSDMTPVRKADANARTVFVHRINRAPGQAKVDSTLVPIDASLPDQAATAKVAAEWTKKAFDSFRADGLNPEKEVTTAWTDFDGHESSVRNTCTDLTDVIGESMLIEGAPISVYNGGSIRIDDTLPEGTKITEYDVLRVLPFGGKVVAGQWTGALLGQVLDAGYGNRGKGGWLQLQGITGQPGAWMIGGAALDPAATYAVVTTEFLLTGQEENLGFLKRDNPGISGLKDGPDVRQLLIGRLAKGRLDSPRNCPKAAHP
ncbi:MAG: 5'-nucleotidase C-terminal domain-containing protein [Myxococcales bacterium]|nr:5'-nucleotidase C-terminal domain-containing protein [Myxococcales bacterium]